MNKKKLEQNFINPLREKNMKRQIIAKINNIADELDRSGLYAEASILTNVMKRLAEDDNGVSDNDDITLTFHEALAKFLNNAIYDPEALMGSLLRNNIVRPGDTRSSGMMSDYFGLIAPHMADGAFKGVIIYEDQNGELFGRMSSKNPVQSMKQAERNIKRYLLSLRGLVEKPYNPDFAYDVDRDRKSSL